MGLWTATKKQNKKVQKVVSSFSENELSTSPVFVTVDSVISTIKAVNLAKWINLIIALAVAIFIIIEVRGVLI